jgi:hypothetical protein
VAIAASSGALPPDGTLRAEPVPHARLGWTLYAAGHRVRASIGYAHLPPTGGTGTAVTLGAPDTWVGATVTAKRVRS